MIKGDTPAFQRLPSGLSLPNGPREGLSQSDRFEASEASERSAGVESLSQRFELLKIEGRSEHSYSALC